MIKAYIAYNITNSPHGGGNQFLRALRNEFVKMGLYSKLARDSDVVVFNSHQNLDQVMEIRRKFPKKTFVHRVDGPMRLYNDMSDNRDFKVYQMNDKVAKATVFQSHWSMERNFEMGMDDNKPWAVIQNSINQDIFNNKNIEKNTEKVRCISTSFSPNYRKGHKFYQFLDSHLDFDKYEYVFVGNSPVKYKNIETLGCLDSYGVARELKKSDVYITASENDPCSNSLLEAVACGLPALALNSGGHPEILKNKKNLFDTQEELLFKINLLENLKISTQIDTIEEVALKYVAFFEQVFGKE